MKIIFSGPVSTRSVDDIWADFHSNGMDDGYFGDFDRTLIEDDFDMVIARPITAPVAPLRHPQSQTPPGA